jgi:hypothetical protein
MHLYAVSRDQWFTGGGLVIADGTVNMTSITFAGSNVIPDVPEDLNTVIGCLIPILVMFYIYWFTKRYDNYS